MWVGVDVGMAGVNEVCMGRGAWVGGIGALEVGVGKDGCMRGIGKRGTP